MRLRRVDNRADRGRAAAVGGGDRLACGRDAGAMSRADCTRTCQPLPSVRPALDFALDEDEFDASVFPAFESAVLDGFAI